jgi:hypothetical protein
VTHQAAFNNHAANMFASNTTTCIPSRSAQEFMEPLRQERKLYCGERSIKAIFDIT